MTSKGIEWEEDIFIMNTDYSELDMTEEEMAKIKELKSRVCNILTSKEREDFVFFLRFLRAREGSVNMAEEMIRKHIHWRQVNNVDDILLYDPPEVWKKYFGGGSAGYDKAGCPIHYLPMGTMDIKGILKSVKKKDILSCITNILEEKTVLMRAQAEKLNRPVYQIVIIFDFDNFSLASATNRLALTTISQVASMFEANYPERLKAAIVINASAYFMLLFAVLKPFLTGRTLSKVKIFGKEGYQSSLRDLIDEDVLPAFLGGKRKDPPGDPRCSAYLVPTRTVPSSYYMRSSDRRLCNQTNASMVRVPRLSKISVTVPVAEPASQIEWEFETEHGDIGFGLGFHPLHSTKTRVVEMAPTARIKSNYSVEVGACQCEFPGNYIITFDNSYSWLKQKEVYYRITIVKPNGERITVTD